MKIENANVDDKAMISINNESLPDQVPILPLGDQVAFPMLNIPLVITQSSAKLVEDAMKTNRFIGVVAVKEQGEGDPRADNLFQTGTLAKVLYMTRTPDNNTVIVVHGLERFRVAGWIADSPYLVARITRAPEVIESDIETDALKRNLSRLTQEVFEMSLDVPKEAIDALALIEDPVHLVYIAAAQTNIDLGKRQEILEMDGVKEKLKHLTKILHREREVLSLGKKIQNEARDEMNKSQREYYLRQQLRAIKKELGEEEEGGSEIDDFRRRLEEADMTEEARKEAERELDRLAEMSPQSAEYPMIKTYLDWVIDLPWNRVSEDRTDVVAAREILDADHYGLKDVKDRIIEYLAVRNLLNIRGAKNTNESDSGGTNALGVILCFAGPPGVGKTSLGQSIARSMGRRFTRMSLGGVRDEAEIRGHRRTYIGALPGRFIQAIKRAGTRNPIFMLDEIDKIGMDWRGDPSSALLEVLDPAQNAAFRDHYLDVDFDLSDVIFIATANQLETIPAPLRDRMEIIQLDGYTESEKVQIARRHLIPRQLEANGLRDNEITFMDESIRKIVGNYTREAGVRQLERQIGAICRKSVVRLTADAWSHVIITPGLVAEYLKKEKFEQEISETIELPGIATGLAVTAVGGDILFVEATRMKGSGKLALTGQLGDVMKESAQIAHSYVRSNAKVLEIEDDKFEDVDVHLHVPAGAIPKDGPSAGVAMILALASLYSNRPVRGDVGMTGEVTLRGRVLPVGGIKMKVLAAHRAGLTTVILPKRNERDLDDVPDEVRRGMDFIMVDSIDDAINAGLTTVNYNDDVSYRHMDYSMNVLDRGLTTKGDTPTE
jgi:ATP-dependent Lon protease